MFTPASARARAMVAIPPGRSSTSARIDSPSMKTYSPSSRTALVVASSAVVRMMWPRSPIPPPPMARRSTPRAASASDSVARPPGLLLSWTTNWFAIGSSARSVAGRAPRTAKPVRPDSRRRGASPAASDCAGDAGEPPRWRGVELGAVRRSGPGSGSGSARVRRRAAVSPEAGSLEPAWAWPSASGSGWPVGARRRPVGAACPDRLGVGVGVGVGGRASAWRSATGVGVGDGVGGGVGPAEMIVRVCWSGGTPARARRSVPAQQVHLEERLAGRCGDRGIARHRERHVDVGRGAGRERRQRRPSASRVPAASDPSYQGTHLTARET